MMIQSVTYQNFKVLRDATLPLGRFTLIVGPNGSGKSAALTGLMSAARGAGLNYKADLSIGAPDSAEIRISIAWALDGGKRTVLTWQDRINVAGPHREQFGMTSNEATSTDNFLRGIRHFSLEPKQIAMPVMLRQEVELQESGGNLPVVLDKLRDQWPERFDALNKELQRWLPEFDHVLFATPGDGLRSVMLRSRFGGAPIRSHDLSEGTLAALALLTISYLPKPPTIITIEEPDRGIHPRLLREVQDALYRLAYPENFDEGRPPVQVIATTHSPYFLDLFRDHPDEVVLAQKKSGSAVFERLSERPDIEEILDGAALGEVWYSGILGGVPAEP